MCGAGRPSSLARATSMSDRREVSSAATRSSTCSGVLNPGIVVETAPNEVRSAHDHLWVEPLSEGLTLYLRAAIEAALGRTVQVRVGEALAAGPSVRIFIEELHGTMTGEARIVARFQVSSGAGAVPRDVHFARSVPLPRAGYAALVEAERALLDQLAIAIGQEMP